MTDTANAPVPAAPVPETRTGPRVVVYPADETGCGFYRTIGPAAILAARGHDIGCFPPGHRNRLQATLKERPHLVKLGGGRTKQITRDVVDRVVAVDADVVVFQRPLARLFVEAMAIIRASGVKIVIELDDDFHNVNARNSAFDAVHPATSPDANFHHLDKALKLADLVTVATPTLQARYGKHRNSIVLPNYIPESYLELRHDPGPVHLGWAGAVSTHPDDLPVVGGGVAQAMADAGLDRFHVVGPPDGVARSLGLHPDAVYGTGWVPTAHFAMNIAERLTVGIAPLQDTAFNRAKSFLKVLEMTACGVPVVASPLPEYQTLADMGLATIAGKPLEWRRALSPLLQDAGYRAAESERVRAVVRSQALTMEAQAHRWWDAWTSVL